MLSRRGLLKPWIKLPAAGNSVVDASTRGQYPPMNPVTDLLQHVRRIVSLPRRARRVGGASTRSRKLAGQTRKSRSRNQTVQRESRVRVFLDTNVLIYFIENPPGWGPRAVARLAALHKAGGIPVVSDLTRLECRVKPMRTANAALLAGFDASSLFLGSKSCR